MPSFNPLLWRTARLIHDQLRLRRRSNTELYLPLATWAKTQQLVRQIDLARVRGWDRAKTTIRNRLLWQLERLRSDLDRVADEVNRRQNHLPLPSVPELAAELHALAEEFEDLECKPKQGYVRVTTPPIVLESIHLGRFQIELDIKALSSSQYYRVIALDPNPASENCSVTHPHVQNEHLCEGEGHFAIQDALAEGRLCDFFLIVGRLLSNYGQGSAYVELQDWRGLPCQSCGTSTADDGCYCQRCDDRLCDSCSLWCEGCSTCYCDNCMASCSQCEESYCPGCLTACADCQKQTCSNCLDEGRCDACGTKSTTQDDETVQSAIATSTPLGQHV